MADYDTDDLKAARRSGAGQGALSAAGAGAGIGAVVGGVPGALIGAGIGAAVGGIGGAIVASKNEKELQELEAEQEKVAKALVAEQRKADKESSAMSKRQSVGVTPDPPDAVLSAAGSGPAYDKWFQSQFG